jgi:membrane protein DedA with SNARE-associated domain
MHQILSFLAEHGGVVLFVAVLAEQLGLPLPALPWIVGAGALAANGQIHLPATSPQTESSPFTAAGDIGATSKDP